MPLRALVGLEGLWQLEIAVGLMLRASALVALAALMCLALRGRAAERHAVWSAILVAAVAVPLLAAAVPERPLFFELPRALVHVDNVPELDGVRRAAAEMVAPDLVRLGDASAAAPGRGPGVWVWLLAIWLGGGAIVGARLAVGLAGVRRIVARASRVDDPVRLRALERARQATGFDRPVDLLETDRFDVPVHLGARRTTVLLPVDSAGWETGTLEAVLIHELTHARRRDWLLQVVGRIACAVYWFHPAVWWAARRQRLEAEIATDRSVVERGLDPVEYAGDVVRVLERAATRGRAMAPDPAIPFARPQDLRTRLEALFGGASPPAPGRVRAIAAALLLAIAVALTGMRPTVPTGAPHSCGHDATVATGAITGATR